jgi:hypothetical protein
MRYSTGKVARVRFFSLSLARSRPQTLATTRGGKSFDNSSNKSFAFSAASRCHNYFKSCFQAMPGNQPEAPNGCRTAKHSTAGNCKLGTLQTTRSPPASHLTACLAPAFRAVRAAIEITR